MSEGTAYRRKNGRGWVGFIDVGRHPATGKRRRTKRTGKTKSEVLKKLREAESALGNGITVDARLTVGSHLDSWASGLDSKVRPATADQYRVSIRCHIKPALGSKLLTKLTPAECDALWAVKLQAGVRPNTVRLMRATLRRALREAERDGLVVRNVAALSQAPKVDPPSGRSMTVAEARNLLDSLASNRLYAAYLIALVLGLRRGELLGLAWADIDFEAQTLRVHQQLTQRRPMSADGRPLPAVLELAPLKTGSRGRRMLELTDDLRDVLRFHLARQAVERRAAGKVWADAGLIFVNEVGQPISPNGFSHAFRTACERAGIGRWHLHEARHSAASLMLAQGTKIEVVSRVLGHSSVTVTADVYGHLMGGEKREAAERMARALLSRGAESTDGEVQGSFPTVG